MHLKKFSEYGREWWKDRFLHGEEEFMTQWPEWSMDSGDSGGFLVSDSAIFKMARRTVPSLVPVWSRPLRLIRRRRSRQRNWERYENAKAESGLYSGG